MNRHRTFDLHAAAVLEDLPAGASVSDAARNTGIADRTIERWIERGRQDRTSPERLFVVAVGWMRRPRPGRAAFRR